MKVFLRDNFAANILSSFTKVWTAMLYSGCYFGSGAFLYSVNPASTEGAARLTQCITTKEIFMTKLALQLFPLVLRFLQCLRQRRDFLVLAASQPVTAAAAAVVEVEMSPAVDYSLEPRIKDALVLNFDTESALFGEDVGGEGKQTSGAEQEGRNSGSFGLTDDKRGSWVEMSDFAPSVIPTGANNPVTSSFSVSVSQCASSFMHCVCIAASAVRHGWRKVWIWPHSYNALRYFLAIMVVLFGALPPQDTDSIAYMCWYIPLCIISTLYSCYWDVIVDYQLFQADAEDLFLRKKLFYYKMKGFYYFVIVANPLLRFMWTLSFTPYGAHPFLVVFEIARRGFWAVLRMEVAYIQELKRRRAT